MKLIAEVRKRLSAFAVQALSVAIDSIFLCVWVLVQWGVDEAIVTRFRLGGVNSAIQIIFQWVFALATLFPVIAYISVDLIAVYWKARRSIEEIRNDDRTA